jgi:hypothetical protein
MITIFPPGLAPRLVLQKLPCGRAPPWPVSFLLQQLEKR